MYCMKHSKSLMSLALTLYILTSSQQSFCQQSNKANDEGPVPGPVNFSTPAATRKEGLQQLNKMIEGDYESWTGGKQYVLTLKEVGKLQRNPRLKDAQAALLGALAIIFDETEGKARAISYDKLMEFAQGKSIEVKRYRGEGNTVKLSFLGIEFMKSFQDLASNKDAKGFQLWGVKGVPTIDGLRQAQISDCVWMAAVGAMVMNHPKKIQAMIHQIAWDRYEVKFPGHDDPVKVTLTDAEISQCNLGDKDGVWMPILGMGMSRIEDGKKSTKAFYKMTPLGAMESGMWTPQALHLLTGRKYKGVGLKKLPPEKVARWMSAAVKNHVPVCICTPDHALSLAGYDEDTKKVTIHNPWGTSDNYKISDEITVKMEKGFFDLPLGKVCHNFSSIIVPEEGLLPAK